MSHCEAAEGGRSNPVDLIACAPAGNGGAHARSVHAGSLTSGRCVIASATMLSGYA